MNTYLIYGLICALSNFVFNVILYILGLHSDPSKLGFANTLGMLGSAAIAATAIYLGQKVVRSKAPSDDGFSFGQALTAGFLISVTAGLFGILTNYLYMVYINPNFKEIIIQFQLDKLAARGISGPALDQAEKGMRMFMKPMMQSVFAVFGTVSIGTIASLVTSFFVKRSGVKTNS
jgi:Protein of unknown function (DUF4199)